MVGLGRRAVMPTQPLFVLASLRLEKFLGFIKLSLLLGRQILAGAIDEVLNHTDS